ncbi:unnamed protein product, partial [marine sediment metagenome]
MADLLPELKRHPEVVLSNIKVSSPLLQDIYNAIPEQYKIGKPKITRGFEIKRFLLEWAKQVQKEGAIPMNHQQQQQPSSAKHKVAHTPPPIINKQSSVQHLLSNSKSPSHVFEMKHQFHQIQQQTLNTSSNNIIDQVAQQQQQQSQQSFQSHQHQQHTDQTQANNYYNQNISSSVNTTIPAQHQNNQMGHYNQPHQPVQQQSSSLIGNSISYYPNNNNNNNQLRKSIDNTISQVHHLHNSSQYLNTSTGACAFCIEKEEKIVNLTRLCRRL